MKSFQVVIVAILFMALLMTSDAYKRKSKKSELEHTFFILFYFFYFLRQHLQYLLTIWDTYATNNTLLYSVYTYTPTFTYLYNIKRGGGDVEQTYFFLKNFQIKGNKKNQLRIFSLLIHWKISVIYFTY